ncbi:putative modified peptide [Stenotrophomonas sp. S48]|uniref:NHLP-related RiPP peptide n=1 Tax=unclassified Stenotrophomonas TaxID=196198 RepID=UPI0018FFC054|nr:MULTISPECIES: NHLP-related RiPP peptide [unclassified Stenotrophomonas]MBK0025127.1 putative modified peptide [Stenotrophomonas sp. S48]MBK0046832.1 putative modified peptide [Stenotrophomonas sp. S49]
MALPSLDIGVARRLVDLLATDDTFRAQFSANPGEALLAVGFDAQRQPAEWEVLRVCFAVRELASKEVIAAARDEINLMLTSGMAQLVPALDAGLGGVHVLRQPAPGPKARAA